MKKIYALIPALFLAVAACSSTPADMAATETKSACTECTECKAACNCKAEKTHAGKKACAKKCECKTCATCKADHKDHKAKDCGCKKTATPATPAK